MGARIEKGVEVESFPEHERAHALKALLHHLVRIVHVLVCVQPVYAARGLRKSLGLRITLHILVLLRNCVVVRPLGLRFSGPTADSVQVKLNKLLIGVKEFVPRRSIYQLKALQLLHVVIFDLAIDFFFLSQSLKEDFLSQVTNLLKSALQAVGRYGFLLLFSKHEPIAVP